MLNCESLSNGACVKKMNLLLILSITCFFNLSWGSEFEYIIGGITPHISRQPNQEFCNEIKAGSGVIFNQTYSYRYNKDDVGGGALVGENSYCKPIWGATSYYRMYKNNVVQIQGTAGFYHFDATKDEYAGGSFFAHVGDFYFVPIVGVEINLNLYQARNFNVKMVNLITPVISNHSIGIYIDI
jgi:hypothetical protein